MWKRLTKDMVKEIKSGDLLMWSVNSRNSIFLVIKRYISYSNNQEVLSMMLLKDSPEEEIVIPGSEETIQPGEMLNNYKLLYISTAVDYDMSISLLSV